jgi:cation transport ATPase
MTIRTIIESIVNNLTEWFIPLGFLLSALCILVWTIVGVLIVREIRRPRDGT